MMHKIIGLTLLGMLMAPSGFAEGVETDVSFIARTDGSEQRYVLWQPSETHSLEACDILIALHGHGSDRWQFIRNPRDECRAVRDTAQKHGMSLLSPDYRAATSWMGPAAEADLVQIIEEYRARYHPGRIVLVGGSMGATAALTFAALHPEIIHGVVAMNGIANHVEYDGFQDAIAASFGGSKTDRPEEYRKRSAELQAERLVMPIALTLGGADTVTPPQSVKRLADRLAALNRPTFVLERPDGGHETNYADACAALEHVLHAIRQQN